MDHLVLEGILATGVAGAARSTNRIRHSPGQGN